MTSACKKLENKKSFIKLLDREGKGSHEDKLKTVSTDKEKKRSGGASASKTKRNKDEMKDLLKESYMFVKEENESLVNKLRRKMRKIEEMKEVIAKLEHTVREYEEMMGMMKHDRATAKTKSGEESLRGSRKYEQIIKQSQDIAKLSLQKYKRIQKEMDEQRLRYQTEITKLKDDNQSLRQQINKMKVQNIELATSKKKARSQYKKAEKEASQNEDLASELRLLREKEKCWIVKEEELKRMLSQINNKINNFEVNCLLTEEKAKKYKTQLDHLQQRYDSKCRKNRQTNEKWHNIFKEIMKETQTAGKDIQNIKKLFLDILRECVSKYQKK